MTIDHGMLELLKSLESSQVGISLFDTREDCLAQLASNLSKARRCVSSKDILGLDQIAQELTQGALKLGAARLLSSTIEIQSLARMGDFHSASELLGSLEVELIEVRASIAEPA